MILFSNSLKSKLKLSDRQNKPSQSKTIQIKTRQDKSKQIQMANQNEDKIRKNYEKLGYKVLHKGCPDFLIFKYDKKTKKFSDVQFIEVKFGGDRLSYEQGVYQKVLKSLGLNYHLVYIPSSKEAQTNQGNTTQGKTGQYKAIQTNPTQLIHIPSSQEAQTNQCNPKQFKTR